MNILKAYRKILRFAKRLRNHWKFGGLKQVHNLFTGEYISLRNRFYRKEADNFDSCFCPCCNWKGAEFLPYFGGGYTLLGALCPKCKSHARHRAHIIFYKEHLRLFDCHGTLLYFAPEAGILPHFKNAPGLIVKTSSFPDIGKSDYSLDIMNIDLPNDSFDYIICHRVIEHVPDDRRAMREIFRILKPGGVAIISVPISYSLSKTIEYGAANPFWDYHYYNYAVDFSDR
jgi:SAM-dependent methyltransferase